MNILFDLDGTLTDPYEGITKCISHALVGLDRSSPPRMSLRWCIGPPLKKSFARLLASDDERLAEAALALYRERYATVGLFENQVYAGIPETLETLREMNHSLYVATSKPTIYAERIIDHFELRRYFTRIYGSGLDGTRCDKADLIAHVLKCESMTRSNAVMIGDREHDILGAIKNGVSGFGVLWGHGTRDELEAAGACACLNAPQELAVYFCQSGFLNGLIPNAEKNFAR